MIQTRRDLDPKSFQLWIVFAAERGHDRLGRLRIVDGLDFGVRLGGLIRPLAVSQRRSCSILVRPIRLRDLRFFLLLQQLDLLRRNVLALEQHKAARGHHVVAIHPLAILLVKAECRAGIGVVRIQLEDPIEVLAAFVAEFVFATPLGQLPMRVDSIWRRAGQLLIFGNVASVMVSILAIWDRAIVTRPPAESSIVQDDLLASSAGSNFPSSGRRRLARRRRRGPILDPIRGDHAKCTLKSVNRQIELRMTKACKAKCKRIDI